MAPTKVLYVINHGLATHLKQILKDGITKSDCYVVSFNENLNNIAQRIRWTYWFDTGIAMIVLNKLLDTFFSAELNSFRFTKTFK